jgi:hypothetical protein
MKKWIFILILAGLFCGFSVRAADVNWPVRVLATVENIDFKALGYTLIYTVPTGCKLVVTELVVKTKTFNAPNGDGEATLKRGSDGTSQIPFVSANLQEGAYAAEFAADYSVFGGIIIISAGDTAKIEITTADTGTALTFDVDLIGYLTGAGMTTNLDTFWTNFVAATASLIQDNWGFIAMLLAIFIAMFALIGLLKAITKITKLRR